MMRQSQLIYLIGPSGVGKTTCALAAAAAFNANLCKLDDLCRGRTNDWDFCREAILRAENNDEGNQRLDIIDVGAGTQHDRNRELADFLRIRRNQAMLIWAPPAEVIKHNPLGPQRNFDEYLRTEYTSREVLYSIPSHRLDISGLPAIAAEERFTDYLAENSFARHDEESGFRPLPIRT